MSQSETALPIVGIGASAGGLDAYRQFLSKLPPEPGAAFVLVQHLDPNHESMMVDLLGRHTAMKVVQAEDEMTLERDHVYMIPPGKFIRMKGAKLLLEQPVQYKGVRLSIDHFFRSIAETFGERAIGIVLSGTGSDGTLGVREIKEAGGMVMVQQPDGAEYDGMPRSAIATGLVDFVAPASELGPQLVEFLKQPYLDSDGPDTGLSEAEPDGFQEILKLLRQHTDFDFRCYKKGTIERRIQRRMGLRQSRSVEDYVRLVQDTPEEVHQLSRDLLIGVTRFFREPEAWESLATNVLAPVISSLPDSATMRAWVPGCATGEEAYTLAMQLFERIDRQNRRIAVQVFATDVNARAIDIARAGRYPQAIAGDLPEGMLKRYFVEDDDAFRVNKRLRDNVVFATQNVISDPPFSKLDIITCRNLMIYLESGVQEQMIEMFHFALAEAGHLFLGSSESAERQKRLFTAVDKHHRIYRRNDAVAARTSRFPILPSELASGRADRNAGKPQPTSDSERARRVLMARFAPAAVMVNPQMEIVYQHGPLRDYLDFPEGEPSIRLPDVAVEGLGGRLRAILNSISAGKQTAESVVQRVRGDRTVRISAHSLAGDDAEERILVTFEDMPPPPGATEEDAARKRGAHGAVDEDDRIGALEYELNSTREDLQSTIEEMETANEELKTSNEEVMSVNEELQSSNEELETSREELQSLNEELSTVNSQLEGKVDEVEATNNDLRNLLASTDIGVIFLDTDLIIRRFTPAMKDIMRIIDGDVGRPVEDIAMRAKDPSLIADARRCLEKLSEQEAEVDADDGGHLIRKLRPYRTSDNKIDGVVVTYTDVTSLRTAHDTTRRREMQQAAVADLGREALSGNPLDEVFDLAVTELARLLNVRFTKVLQLEPDGQHLWLRSGIGWQPGLVKSARVHTGKRSQAGFTLRRAAPVVVRDFAKEERFTSPKLLRIHDIRCGASVIIGPVESPWGVLGVHESELGRARFDEDDVNFIQAVANTLWLAISSEQAQLDIQRERAELRGLTDGLPIFFAVLDREGRYEFVNAAYHVFGRPLSEIEGTKVTDLVDPAAAKAIAPYLQAGLAGEPQTFEVSVMLPDHDAPRIRHVTYMPRMDNESDEITGLFTASVDVTDQKEMERNLLERTLQYRELGDSIAFGVWITDADGKLTYISESFLQMVGMSFEEAVEGWTDKLAPGTVEATVEAWNRCREEGGSWEREHTFEGADGETYHVLALGRAVRDDAGRITSWVGLNLDITDRKEEEQRLRIVTAELDHRVKNVLSIVATLAKMTGRSVDTVAEYSAALEARIQAMASAHKILAEAGWRGMRLRELLEIELVPYQSGRRANIEYDGPDLLLQPSFAQLMSLGFHELATNAAKYGGLADPGASLKVQWRHDGRFVLDWIETSAKPVQPPTKSGFGSTLLNRVLAGVPGVTISMDFRPEGLRFRLVADEPYTSVLEGGTREHTDTGRRAAAGP